MQQGVYFRVDRRLLEEFTRAAERMGLSRSEALRIAMRMFVESSGVSRTSRMRGLVRGSRLSSRELEEAYLVGR